MTRQVAALLARATAAGLFPGAVAAWGGDGPEVAHIAVHGVATLTPRPVPVSDTTVFDLASLTKPLVTGTLVMLARRAGRLGLQSRVRDLLPEAAGCAAGDVTIVQLLTHTGGFPDWVPLYVIAEGKHRDEALNNLLEIPLVGPPGGQVIYSCAGFLILTAILERVFGESLERLFERLVAQPLGLGDRTRFVPDPAVVQIAGGACEAGAEKALLAELGLEDRVSAIPEPAPGLPDDGNSRFLGGIAGNAGLFSDVRGALVLAEQYLPERSRILEPSEIALATANHTAELGSARGLAWQGASSPGSAAGPALSRNSFGHNGFTGTSVWVDPEEGRVHVCLTNRHHPAHRGMDLHPFRRRFHSLTCGALSTG